MQLAFLGGTGRVTGSKALLEHDGRRLLVDCGLFQGVKQLRLRNWEPLPVSRIDAVLLTHAHLDHSGFVPRLVELGFAGSMHATEATRDLCELLLPDSGHLLEEEAQYANRHGFSRHRPALPLYDEAAARRALEHFAVQRFDADFEPLPCTPASAAPAICSARPACGSNGPAARCCSRATSDAATTC